MKPIAFLSKSVFFILLILLCSCESNTSIKKQPFAEKGILDLKNWDFKKDGVVYLNGNWEFYWNQLIQPKDFRDEKLFNKTGYFKIPDKWNNHQVNSKTLTGEGYATFRLTIYTDQSIDNIALKITDMGTAYRLWVDGKILLSNGIVGKSRETMKPQYLPDIAVFQSKTGIIQLVLQVSNFMHKKGGVWKPLEIGTIAEIKKKRERNLAFELFLFGSLLIMGCYHMGLFILRRKDQSSFYFGIVCILSSIRVISTGERFLIGIFPDFNWEVSQKLEYLTFYLAVPLFFMFLNVLFPEINKKLAQSMLGLGILFSVFTIFTYTRIFSHLMIYYQIITAIFCLYVLLSLIRAIIHRRKGASWISMGVIILIASVFHDLLLVNELIHSIPLAPFGLFFFIFIQAFILSLRFSKAFSDLETMSQELSNYANHMEELVDQRTDELNQSYIELKQTNDKISDSINYASIIQTSLLPDSAITKKFIPDSFFIWKPRDVVGGDYFLLEPVEKGFILAAIDCTGHGIPGALMTMIASSGLRRIINEEKCSDPAMILKRLNYIVTTTLKQDKKNTTSDIGLDGSICFVNTVEKKLLFAGARLSLVYIKDSNLHLINGDRQSVGYKNSDLDFDYTSHTIDIDNNISFYLYTDGIIDQSVEEKKYSLGHKRFHKILNDVSQKPFEQQKSIILETFNRLKGENEVRDDITVIGFKPTV